MDNIEYINIIEGNIKRIYDITISLDKVKNYFYFENHIKYTQKLYNISKIIRKSSYKDEIKNLTYYFIYVKIILENNTELFNGIIDYLKKKKDGKWYFNMIRIEDKELYSQIVTKIFEIGKTYNIPVKEYVTPLLILLPEEYRKGYFTTYTELLKNELVEKLENLLELINPEKWDLKLINSIDSELFHDINDKFKDEIKHKSIKKYFSPKWQERYIFQKIRIKKRTMFDYIDEVIKELREQEKEEFELKYIQKNEKLYNSLVRFLDKRKIGMEQFEEFLPKRII